MPDTYTPDKWYLSTRIYAMVAMMLVLVLQAFGVSVAEQELVDLLTMLGALIGGVLAFWSKIRESKKL